MNTNRKSTTCSASQEEIEYVRSLDDWKPQELSTFPTSRLKLDLSSITKDAHTIKQIPADQVNDSSWKSISSKGYQDTQKPLRKFNAPPINLSSDHFDCQNLSQCSQIKQNKGVEKSKNNEQPIQCKYDLRDLDQDSIDLIHAQNKRMGQVFRKSDKNRDVDKNEFQTCLEGLGCRNDHGGSIEYHEFAPNFLQNEVKTALGHLNLQSKQNECIKLLCSENDSKNHAQESHKKMKLSPIQQEAIDRFHQNAKDLRKLFIKFDVNSNGFIEPKELEKCCLQSGLNMKDFDQLLSCVPRNAKNQIDYACFSKAFSLQDDGSIQGMNYGDIQKEKLVPLKLNDTKEEPNRIVMPIIKRTEFLTPSEKNLLKVQEKILHQTQQMTRNDNRIFQRLFQECQPDILGFANQKKLEDKLKQLFHLSNDESKLLNNFFPTTENDGQVHRQQFYKYFYRIDTLSNKTIDDKKSGRKRYDPETDPDRPSSWKLEDSLIKKMQQSNVSLNVFNLSPHQRIHFKDAKEISHLLDNFGKKIEKRFHTETNNSMKQDLKIQTKLPIEKVSDMLHQYGIDITNDRLVNLVGPQCCQEGITYSQLIRETNKTIQQYEVGEVIDENLKKKCLNGDYVGCRGALNKSALDQSSNSHHSNSQFLIHDMTTKDNGNSFRTYQSLEKLRQQKDLPAGLTSEAFVIKNIRKNHDNINMDSIDPISSSNSNMNKVQAMQQKYLEYEPRWINKTIQIAGEKRIGLGGGRRRMNHSDPKRLSLHMNQVLHENSNLSSLSTSSSLPSLKTPWASD